MSGRRGRIVVSLCLACALLLEPPQAHADTFDRVVRALKGVAWAALSIGVDEAGSRLLGPTIWGIVKRIGEPAVKELTAGSDQKPTPETVTRVVYLLDRDSTLRQTMRTRFDALPGKERDALADKLAQIENHLVRIERLVSEQSQSIGEIKALLLSVLRTPILAAMPANVPGLRHFDTHNSPLAFFYPMQLTPPRRDNDVWIAGARVEQGFVSSIFDADQPVISFRVLGVPHKATGRGVKPTLDEVRQFLGQKECDPDSQQFLVQEFSERGYLVVSKCDQTWPLPNTYLAMRLFSSNGANVLAWAFAVGDDMWKEYETPLLDSMRLTRMRAACGFYATACCLPAGDDACESGLTCREGQCLPEVVWRRSSPISLSPGSR